ncbi:hypothetical protein AOC05_09320 [Arthrobacter alpinus]|uniref:DUF559 domain-containing protein n=2 Tax=Arthrobacter alpinus TaxID=656366 RepID=A0A0M4RBQ7_9MICC|nr:hypothetical protein AOC05_09320 [Arthrobacter alpinus]
MFAYAHPLDLGIAPVAQLRIAPLPILRIGEPLWLLHRPSRSRFLAQGGRCRCRGPREPETMDGMSIHSTLLARPVQDTIAAMGKVARRKDLLQLGYTAWNLKQALNAGTVRCVARGYFALPDADPLDVLLAQHQARKTCFTKAEELGLWILQPMPMPHVAVAHGRQVPGCLVHRVKGRQMLTDILRQCVGCGTELEGLVVLESAVVLKKCTIRQLRQAFQGSAGAAGRAIIGMIDPQAQSIVETVARYTLKMAGYNVQGQVAIRGVGHLDLLVEGVLGVETDGEKYHNTPQGWAEDLRRDNLLVIGGVWKLRIPAKVVLWNPELMLLWIRQALERIDSTTK